MTADNPAARVDLDALRSTIAAYLCNVSNLPKPLRAPALGLHMGELIDGLADRLAPLLAERDDLELRLSTLLCDLTGGRMSKTNYPVTVMAQAIEAEFEKYATADAAEIVARAETAEAERDEIRARLDDLTSRLGFGPGYQEPQADNDTIVAWFEEQGRDANEWRESQLWRNDCYAAGHPDDEDCPEHDPVLRLLTAEAERDEARAELAALRERVEALADKWDDERKTFPTRTNENAAYAETAVRLCGEELRAALADPEAS